MRNSFLPPLPSQPVFSLGNEFRMPGLDISSVLDSKINAHTDSLWSLPRLFNDEEMKGANLGTNYFQPIIISSPHTDYKNTLLNDAISAQEQQERRRNHLRETTKPAQLNERKSHLEMATEHVPDAEETKAPTERKNNKRKRALCSAQEFHPQAKRNSAVDLHTSNMQVTARRSQKIGDKITALQKLVSPYGKTDTASVLQEASLYIKLLQEQIQNLFQMLSSSCSSIRQLQLQEYGKKQKSIDLRSRGLCLVPVSTIQEATEESKVDNHSTYPQSPLNKN